MENVNLLGAGGTLKSTLEAIQAANRQVSILLLTAKGYTGWVFRVGEDWVVVRLDSENRSDTSDVMIPFRAIASLDLPAAAQMMRTSV